MLVKIKIKVGKAEVELTAEEARELVRTLQGLLEEKVVIRQETVPYWIWNPYIPEPTSPYPFPMTTSDNNTHFEVQGDDRIRARE